MKKILLLVIFILAPPGAPSQQINIEVNNLTTDSSIISALSGERTTPTDTVSSSGSGKFVFDLIGGNHPRGIYRISFGKNKWIDFIHDGDDVTIRTDADHMSDSLKVGKSESNRLYYSFISLNRLYKTKSELLQLILARYPRDDDYYETTQSTISRLQKEYSDFIHDSQGDGASFIARYIRSAQLPLVDFSLPVEKQLAFLKNHSLDKVDFDDEEMINSDLFSNKAIEYLTYYRNPQFPKELLEKEFMTAVDTLLNKAKVNTFVYKHIVEYLLDGFKKFGFDAIINYILENYVIKDDLCIEQSLETALQRRMEQARYLKIGTPAPNIILPDSAGKRIILKDITKETIIIIFYASWCPHCQTLLPQINDLYNKQKEKKTEVIAVSIDTGKTEWLKYITANRLNWVNVSDLKGWNGPAVVEYFIYATPTIFVLDNKKEIIGKPLSLEEIREHF